MCDLICDIISAVSEAVTLVKRCIWQDQD